MPIITLSFDNGPDPETTPRVLDVLGEHDIRTSFFVVGQQMLAPGAAQAVERAAREGHWVGNHTFSHSPPLGERSSPTLAEDEIERTQALLGQLATGRIFRPSGGGGNLDKRLLTRACFDYLVRERYTCVLWHSVPGDLRGYDWVANAFADLRQRDWTLLVLHDLPHGAIARLPEFLRSAKDQGYAFRQEFPPNCVPMVDGNVVHPMQHLISD